MGFGMIKAFNSTAFIGRVEGTPFAQDPTVRRACRSREASMLTCLTGETEATQQDLKRLLVGSSSSYGNIANSYGNAKDDEGNEKTTKGDPGLSAA
jgi:hypothetical protein